LLAGMVMVPCVSAEEQKSDKDIMHQQTWGPQESPVIVFDGLTIITPQTILEKTSYAEVSSSIKKYEIISFDVKTLKKQLLSKQKIPIHLNGTPYIMDLHEDTFYPSAETGVFTFTGHLESSKDGKEIPGSEAHLTMDDVSVIGKISLDIIHYYSIDETATTGKSSSGKAKQYAYYSGDVESRENPMGEDRYVVLPSGESKPLSALSAEELKKYISDSGKNNGKSYTTMGPFDWYNVNILIVCDNEMYNRYSNWVTRAQSVVSDANSAMSYNDIKIRLVPSYDASQRSVLSSHFNAATPLQVFWQYVPNSYLNSKNADIAMYMSGNQFSTCIGAGYGFDSGPTYGRHAVMMYERSTGGGYSANPQERANVFTHEVGHLFDADHQTAPSQTEFYNRATTYLINGVQLHTLMYSYVTSDPTYFSSDDLYGDFYHDNAQRLRETKATVSDYI
ncbi:MAG: M12 family metallo-peptidase, partial [Methanoregula sp.]|nr:M12 family metallo-peptidase [Methanoregula sp.]